MNTRIPIPADLDTDWLAKKTNAGRSFNDAREVIEAATRLLEEHVEA